MSKKKGSLFTSPNHWSLQEPDGLAQFSKHDPVTGITTYWRAPWPKNLNAQPGGGDVPRATLHRHTKECTVLWESQTEETVNGTDSAWTKQVGRSWLSYGERETRLWCRHLRMPIFGQGAEVAA